MILIDKDKKKHKVCASNMSRQDMNKIRGKTLEAAKIACPQLTTKVVK